LALTDALKAESAGATATGNSATIPPASTRSAISWMVTTSSRSPSTSDQNVGIMPRYSGSRPLWTFSASGAARSVSAPKISGAATESSTSTRWRARSARYAGSFTVASLRTGTPWRAAVAATPRGTPDRSSTQARA
jgi:hypothetical protein